MWKKKVSCFCPFGFRFGAPGFRFGAPGFRFGAFWFRFSAFGLCRASVSFWLGQARELSPPRAGPGKFREFLNSGTQARARRLCLFSASPRRARTLRLGPRPEPVFWRRFQQKISGVCPAGRRDRKGEVAGAENRPKNTKMGRRTKKKRRSRSRPSVDRPRERLFAFSCGCSSILNAVRGFIVGAGPLAGQWHRRFMGRAGSFAARGDAAADNSF